MAILDCLATLGVIWYFSLGSIGLGGWYCSIFIYNRPPRLEEASLQNTSSPGVSILRPLCGLEPKLEECLASAFQSSSKGSFEVILSVADEEDAAIPVARKVMAAFPDVQSKLVVGEVEAGPNPKINNLIRSYENARYPILWILDSNSWVSPGTLDRSATYFNDPKVNLVHHIPIAHSLNGSLSGAKLDDVYMGTMHAKMYSIINYCNVAPCVMGKSNLIRRAALNDDGLRPFAKYIAEDHLIATELWHGRGSHVLGIDCVRQPLDEVSVATFSSRRIRWIRVRKYMVTASTLVEPLTECFLNGLIGCSSICYLGLAPFSFWTMFVIHSLSWAILDFAAWSHLHNLDYDGGHPFSVGPKSDILRRWWYVWLTREIGAFPLWLVAMFSDKIDWRGMQFVIARDMTARRVA